ncbi:ubiquitin carboxyl-terminal hydrolase isozyme L3-like [Photinus pyralis]|uniref:ubiquitin carboxyl-terminal hydrolase isozyme L3-like n=1 Tax=Photinus pyralis TaxID=7054 RepID=UPI0012670407|nr:ubiquitin carboxyl-terminal hydrolase isozyme L3-like [Photinus pyralis]
MSLLPLESNPDVLNKFLQKLGVPEKWSLVDVFGLDADSLAWVPKPVLSVILLFPISETYQTFAETQANEIKEAGQTVTPDLYYVKQMVSNACGTVALIHSIANNMQQIEIAEGPFKKLLDESKNMTPAERGELLQKSAAAIMDAHRELESEGQTTVSSDLSDVDQFLDDCKLFPKPQQVDRNVTRVGVEANIDVSVGFACAQSRDLHIAFNQVS